jgi:hypothetical protein
MSENAEDTAPNEQAAQQSSQSSAEQSNDQSSAEQGPVDQAAIRPSEETLAAARADQEQRDAEPNKPVAREAKEGVAGESFGYLAHVGVNAGGEEQPQGI